MNHAPNAPAKPTRVSLALSDAQREWIVRRLAASGAPSAIRREVRERFGIEASRQTIWRYGPSRNLQCPKRWAALFCTTRREHDAGTADLTASVRQVERLARRIVEILERRILAGPGAAPRRGVRNAGPITDDDRLRALMVFVARMRVTNPAGVAEIRRALFDVPRSRRKARHAG